MRVITASLPGRINADYNRRTGTIRLNISLYKKDFPTAWRRKAFAGLLHEITHHVYAKIKPWQTLLECYEEELTAYRVQRIAELVLTGRFQHNTPEDGAINSTVYCISWMKQYYRLNGKPFEW